MYSTFEHITIIGNGNVARILTSYLKNKNYPIQLIVGRNELKTKTIAEQNNLNFQILNSEPITIESDLILICVSDIAIDQVISKIKTGACIAHVSGTSDISLLKKFDYHAVFYPLQTFSSFSDILHLEIPFLIETNTPILEEKFRSTFYSEKIENCNSETRKKLHLAAVMVNNFTNSVMVVAQEYCQLNNISFDLLKPLLTETLNQNLKYEAKLLQTGPAKRNDISTINKHLEMLENNESMSKFYQFFSEFIRQRN